MVVSHFFSPLRTLKKKTRKTSESSESSSVGDAGSDDDSNKDSGNRHKDENKNPKDEEKTLVAGLCFCCNQKVMYPASVSCFKCTVCDTINNLRAVERIEKVVASDGSVTSRVRTPPPPLTLDRLRAGIQAYKRHPEKQGLLEAMLRESFGNWDVLNVSFPMTAQTGDGPAVAIDDVHTAYKLILALPAPFIRAMMGGVEQILRRPGRPLRQKSDVRYLLIIIENPLLMQQSFTHEASYHHRIVKSIVGTLANLPPHVHYALVLWSSQHGRSALRRKIALVNQFISYRVQKYDRARRRNQANSAQRAANNQLTAYSSQSNQTELPAFQRTRSVTNAPPLPPHPPHAQEMGAAGLVLAADRATKHARMRSNTDSRVSLSSRERSSILTEHSVSGTQRRPPPAPSRAAGAHSSLSDECRAGLGIANVAARPEDVHTLSTQDSHRLHADILRHNHRHHRPHNPHAPGHTAATRVATAPGQLHVRTAVQHSYNRPSSSVSDDDDDHYEAASRRAPPLHIHAVAPFKSSPTLKATATQLPLRHSDEAETNMTAFVPIASPEIDPSHNAHMPPPVPSAGGHTGKNHDDAVRPPRDSVLGVLDGTAEPRSPFLSRKAGCGSLTRTRSSSEAPVRRRNNNASAATAASPSMIHNIATAPEPPSSHAVGDWGAGIDLDDYYVGADGVFYPKTSALVMYQNDWRLVAAAKVMALLHAANLLLPNRARLSVDAFYNKAIESMNLVADYDAWQARTPGAFSFCQYPFLLSLAAKVQIMQVDAARQMDSKLKEAVISALFQSYRSRMASNPANQPHLKLLVRRHCLVEDSLHQLATHEQDLKKRLKIEFVGEEGIDAGGLTKEWFMLLVRELLNPMYGMFTRESYNDDSTGSLNSNDYDDDSATAASWSAAYWFNPASLEASNQYFLVGVVVGLALYNSNILDLQLPLAVFKKLLRTSFYQTQHSLSAAAAAAASFSASSVSPVMSAARSANAVAKGGSSATGNGATADGLVNSGAHKPRYVVSASGTTSKGGLPGVNASATTTVATVTSGGSGNGGGSTADGRSPIYGLLSPSAQLRYQINEMLSDVSQFRPHLARGLRQLLLYRNNDVEDVFCLTFEASYDAFGQVITVPLVPNGANIAVTSQNRVEYVMRYLQWVLNDSVSRQFEPFRRGFYYVCGGNALSLFKPEEIELMVHGSGSDWNPEDLRAITEHINFSNSEGSLPDHSQLLKDQLVCWFWEILTEFAPEDRRMFLSFVTGADRMPTIASSPRLKMKLALLGDDFNRLPVARTCFNQLGIWLYRSKEELKAKLMLAIRESEGFGLE
ncbi:putative E3 ubiquitin-protein ligase [Coemansia sp. RSA 986]|nr:putative E3 ubiquitin-protein ligase [Coemansia sp. RSA 986]